MKNRIVLMAIFVALTLCVVGCGRDTAEDSPTEQLATGLTLLNPETVTSSTTRQVTIDDGVIDIVSLDLAEAQAPMRIRIGQPTMMSAVSLNNRLVVNGVDGDGVLKTLLEPGVVSVAVEGAGMPQLELALESVPAGSGEGAIGVRQSALVAGRVLGAVKKWLKKTAFKRFVGWFDYCGALERFVEDQGYWCPWSNDDPVFCPAFYLATCAPGAN